MYTDRLSKLLLSELLVELSIRSTLELLSVHVLTLWLHLIRLVTLLALTLSVYDLIALLLTHPTIVAVGALSKIVIEAPLASPVLLIVGFAPLVGSLLSFFESIVERVVVLCKFYNSLTSGDAVKFVTFLDNFLYFWYVFTLDELLSL